MEERLIKFKKEDVVFIEDGFMSASGQEKLLEDIDIKNEGLKLRALVLLKYKDGYLLLNTKNNYKLIGADVLKNGYPSITAAAIDTVYLNLKHLIGISKGDIYVKSNKFIGSLKDDQEIRLVYELVLDKNYDIEDILKDQKVVFIEKNKIHSLTNKTSNDFNLVYDNYIA